MDYEARDIRAIIIIVLTILCFFEAYTYFTSYKSYVIEKKIVALLNE